MKKLRQKMTDYLVKFISSIREVTTAPRDLTLASAVSLLVTLSYIICLYAAIRAFNIHIGLTGTVFVYASAVIARSAIPTPGGLGPLEIAMVTTLVGLGVPKYDAFSAVILYRLATFWLPIPFSLLAYKYLNSKKYI
jgi:uncharacterized protein (TIRG00374 family)